MSTSSSSAEIPAKEYFEYSVKEFYKSVKEGSFELDGIPYITFDCTKHNGEDVVFHYVFRADWDYTTVMETSASAMHRGCERSPFSVVEEHIAGVERCPVCRGNVSYPGGRLHVNSSKFPPEDGIEYDPTIRF
jgi:hypothetical protein